MRIAIVNDVNLAVEALRRVVAHARGHQLAWVAHNGAEAVKQCARDRPDLVLMDLIMPTMDGVEATRQIMSHSPCAIMVVTASVFKHSAQVFEAMGAGALDAADTPTFDKAGHARHSDVLLGKINTISRLLGSQVRRQPAVSTGPPERPPHRLRHPIVALGASAGGPAALAAVLKSLPGNFPAPVVVVQHVDARFAHGFADWLDTQTPLRVRLAHQGDRPLPGHVLVAGETRHLVFISPNRVGYSPLPTEASYRPSIDVFFKSVNLHWNGDVIGVLLTGMGRDGAAGLKALHDAGHFTIVQDRASSVVYGMPKAAAELKAATRILPLDKIGHHLANMVARNRSSERMS